MVAPEIGAVAAAVHRRPDLQPTWLFCRRLLVVMQASAEGALRAFFNLYLDRQL
ncbi:MAG: hypothetical protein IPO29_06550 [Anaerolineae bacterium]|nr:hypothetical protein [Anaerolineae bacterium]